MTIICYRSSGEGAGTMSCDSGCFQNSAHIGDVKKIWRVGGGLVGMAGNIVGMLAFLRWISKNCPDSEEEYPASNWVFDAIVVDSKGNVSYYEAGIPDALPITAEYCAIGSARDIGLGAMGAGATPTQAARLGVKHHADCKGPVKTYKLKGK